MIDNWKAEDVEADLQRWVDVVSKADIEIVRKLLLESHAEGPKTLIVRYMVRNYNAAPALWLGRVITITV